jgi:hypothetical protein
MVESIAAPGICVPSSQRAQPLAPAVAMHLRPALELRRDDRVQQGDRGSSGDRDRTRVHLRPGDAHKVAGVAEEPLDVMRVVRERLPACAVDGTTPRRQLRTVVRGDTASAGDRGVVQSERDQLEHPRHGRTSVMRGEGLEPSRPFEQWLLRPPCLPFHHPRAWAEPRPIQCTHTLGSAPSSAFSARQ